MKSGVIHLAAWSCRRLKFTGRVSGDFPGGLLPVLSRLHRKRRQPVFAVPITDVMVNPSDRRVQKKPRRAFCKDFTSPGSDDCFCLVEIYHLCSHDDHIPNRRMSYRCHDIDHMSPFLDIPAQTNILPSVFPYSFKGLNPWRYEIVPRFIYIKSGIRVFNLLAYYFYGYSFRSHFRLCR